MNLCINDFEGPLDLLLHLVKSSQMSIYEIDTCKVIEEYLNFINSIDKNDLDDASEYLVMAAELIHLKSKLLVNQELEEESDEEYEINSEEDLKNKLIEYEKYKEISEAFRNLEENRKDYFTKIPESINEFRDNEKIHNDGSVTIEDLMNAFLELKKREEYHKPMHTRITRREISVEEKTTYIRNILKKKKKIEFKDLFESFEKENVIVTFLSILNMSKNNEIILTQKKLFGSIFIERK
jgi:segregation and condensation protein A